VPHVTNPDPSPDAPPRERRPLDVLVADDEAMVRDLLGRVLSRHGHRVHQAGNAEEALRVVRAQHIDVVLADDQMPGSGRRVVEVLAEDGFTGVVALMGGALSGEPLPTGTHTLRKPFDLTRLLEVVEGNG
jgi:CheY-like chemotaxis protein